VLLNGVHCKKQAKNGVAKASFDRPKLKHCRRWKSWTSHRL